MCAMVSGPYIVADHDSLVLPNKEPIVSLI